MKTITFNLNIIFVVVFTCIFGYDIWRVWNDVQLSNSVAISYAILAWMYIICETFFKEEELPVAQTYLVQFKNEKLNAIADDCGLIVDGYNTQATEAEIEFFAEQVVKECMDVLSERAKGLDAMGGRELEAQIYDNAISLIARRFGYL